MDRGQVADALEEIALLLELRGENPFRARAYQNAARTVRAFTEDLPSLVASGRLGGLKGVGEAISEKISTLVTTGGLPWLDELRSAVPRGLLQVLQVPGLGPRRAALLHEKLGVDSLAALEAACRDGRLEALPGFGKKSQEKILAGIDHLRRNLGRSLLSDASAAARAYLAFLESHPGVVRASLAGSVRRRRETIGDVDLVASSPDPARVIADFTRRGDVAEVMGAGGTRASVRLASGLQVDLRVVEDAAFPFALNYFTGSKAHNVALRRRAESRFGLKLNEYGLFRGGGEEAERIPCADEAALYDALGLACVPPELREDMGEIEAAEAGGLPRLVERGEIRGVFHVHSTWSDGRDDLEAMIRGAEERGFEYVGISEHSRSAGYAGGLKIEDVERQRGEIEKLRAKHPRIRILHGTESDILPDGSLDYPPELLERLDFVVGSVHSAFNQSEEEMTRRVIRALENPLLTILGHPTGRLLLARDGFRIDLGAVIDAAARTGSFIEINANPHRLDLDAVHARRARDAGVLLSINPDAHDVEGLDDVEYGVDTARRGWLSAEHVLNTRPWEEIRTLRDRKRARA